MISLCPVPPVRRVSALLKLLSGKILLQVAIVARQRQAVCDPNQEGYWPTVLLQLSGFLLHMYWVAAGESREHWRGIKKLRTVMNRISVLKTATEATVLSVITHLYFCRVALLEHCE